MSHYPQQTNLPNITCANKRSLGILIIWNPIILNEVTIKLKKPDNSNKTHLSLFVSHVCIVDDEVFGRSGAEFSLFA